MISETGTQSLFPSVVDVDRGGVLFILPSLGGGGAERVVTHLLRYLSGKGDRVALAVFSDDAAYPDAVPAVVRIFCMGKRSRWEAPLMPVRLAALIRRLRPAVLVSFLHYSNIIAAMARSLSGWRCRLVISERNYPPRYLEEVRFPQLVRFLLRRWYPRADLVIAVTEGVRRSLVDEFGLDAGKVIAIPNPVPVRSIGDGSREEVGHRFFEEQKKVVLYVGRITRQKRVDRLLRAFAAATEGRSDTGLILLGAGELLDEMRALAETLALQDRISFVGFRPNPYPWMRRAHVLGLSSEYEGFPNVIVEAMALGVPVVATDCRTGPADIIEHGRSGFLVEADDDEAFAGYLRRVLYEPGLRDMLSAHARRRAGLFDVQRISPRFEAAIRGDGI